MYCQTRQDPIQALEKSLDELAPLMMTKTFNTGVAKASVIPVPLNKRQRNRIAWNWIVQSANQRVSSDFAVRLGEELTAIAKALRLPLKRGTRFTRQPLLTEHIFN